MSGVTTAVVVFVIGVATGFFDSTIGAGGLISVPALVFLGFSPEVAIATDRFGSIGQSLAATYICCVRNNFRGQAFDILMLNR